MESVLSDAWVAPQHESQRNCSENAAVESYIGSLKNEKIRRHIFKTHEVARTEILDYIEVIYNWPRRHHHLDNISPTEYEQPMVKLD